MTWKWTTVAAVAGGSLLGSLQAAVITLENFTGVADGTLLTSVRRWTLQSGSPGSPTWGALVFRRWRSCRATTLLAAACLFAAPAVFAESVAFEETFSAAQDGSALVEAEGWKLSFGEDSSARVELAAGFSGQGARIERKEQYQRLIPEDHVHFLQEGIPGEFRMKIRFMTPNDGYTIAQVLIGRNDGIHGLALRFNGGEHDGFADNFLQVSRGGKSWGVIEFANFKAATWQKQTWYEIAITDILPEAGSGSNKVHAKLTVREVDGAQTVLLEAVPIESVGTTGGFTKINVVLVGNCGAPSAFDIDDIKVQAGPSK
ncbi:MAG: hypothetical protein B9S32_01010 [Verrucomicrobia bacterium Tous-C9LFEB]|nr:MAG: hypothetical protein B9S32_01010 [Verrucomicrobia bacterium Tous-C9LFEB]